MFYVYVYCNPLKPSTLHECGFEPFYVGKGQRDREKYHLSEECLLFDGNRHKTNTIKKILRKGLKPIIVRVIESDDEDFIYSEEKRLISYWGRRDTENGVLCNLTDGGEGKRGYVTPDVTKKKISQSRRRWLSTLTGEERKTKLGTMKDKKHTEAAKLKMSIGVSSALKRPEVKKRRCDVNSGSNNPRARSVEIQGKIFRCILDAERHFQISKYHLKKDPTFKYV